MPSTSPLVSYQTVVHGTRLTPDHFNTIFNLIFNPSASLSEYRQFDDSFLSDAPEDIKQRFLAYVNQLQVTQTSGLGVQWAAGNLGFGDGNVYSVAAGSGSVANDDTSYVYVNENGVVMISTTMPSKVFLMAEVIAASGVITSLTDRRTRYRLSIPFGGDAEVSDVDVSSISGFPSGSALKGLRVNTGEDAIEFYEIPGSGGGSISYSVVTTLPVVDGTIVSLAAGITAIYSDAALLPVLSGEDNRITVSSTYSSVYPSWKALNGFQGSYDAWITTRGVDPAITPQWWQFDFDSAVTLGRIDHANRQVSGLIHGAHGQLKDFKIQTFDGSTWTDRLTVVGEPPRGEGEVKTSALGAAVTAVQSLRLWITGVHVVDFGYGLVPLVDLALLQAYSSTSSSSGVAEVKSNYVQSRQGLLKSISATSTKCFVSAGYLDQNDKILRVDLATRSVDGDFDLGSTVIYSVSTETTSVPGSYIYSVNKIEESAPLACLESSSKVYIGVGDTIRIYGETTGNLVSTVATAAGPITDLAISIEQQKLFASTEAGEVVILDTGLDTIVSILDSGTSAEFVGSLDSVAIDDSRDSVYISNFSTNKVLVVNTVTNTLVTTISVGTEPKGIAVAPTLGKGIVCNTAGNLVSIINLTGNTVAASIAMSLVGSNAYPIDAAIDETSQKGFIALKNYNQVLIIDLTTNQIESRIPVATSPVSVVWISSVGELYVASEDGKISVIKRI